MASDNAGVIRAVTDADPGLVNSPLTFLGRFVETSGKRRLGELLLESDDLSYLGRREDGAHLVRGYVQANGQALEVRVAIDPERGFCPVEIQVFDGIVHSLSVRWRATEALNRDGIWLPVAGEFCVYARTAPAPKDER
ncbi:MAG TPA: hypothetical protein VD963_02455 [Phycisphaerales bacterium]|nr:hypothetical protein [Phycisphaerales bacterium]